MQSGRIALRARHENDVAILQAELHDDDVDGWSRAGSRPWQPIPPGCTRSPFAVRDPTEEVTYFSTVELAGRELAGEALLWGIDTHYRTAHLGIALRPAFRGRGLGGDVVRALCSYGFGVRGLHRLQLETLADNAAMIAAAERAGFTREGLLRRSAWVCGAFVDQVILGQTADEWTPPPAPERGAGPR